MKCYIYILISPIDGKVRYIGKTKRPHKREREHCYECHLKKRNRKNNWIKSLLNNNLRPVFEVIDEVDIDEVDFYETYWISQFKTWGFDLVNSTDGGDGLINPSNEARKNIGNSSRGRIVSDETRLKISKSNYNNTTLSKPIVVYNENGDFVKEYFNSRRASEDLNISYKSIHKVLNGLCHFYKGYTFFDKNDINIDLKLVDRLSKKINKNMPFYKLSLNGDIISEYNSIITASKEIDVNFRNIHQCLNNIRRSCGGYFWIYKEEYNEVKINKINKLKKIKTNSKIIHKIDIETGDILKEYKSVKEASEDFSVSSSSIVNNCKGNTKTCAGFKFKFKYK